MLRAIVNRALVPPRVKGDPEMFDLSSIFEGIQSFLSQIFGFYGEILSFLLGPFLGGL